MKMKLKTMTVFFAMLLGFAVMFIGTEQASAIGGEGTTENPYQISTYAELIEFAQAVNGGNTAACAKLTADIVCTDETWVPIGTEANPYTGTFNGHGHVIKNLSNDGCTATDYQGLFGDIGSGGKVQDLGLEDVYIHGTSFVGGVAGHILGEAVIRNCYNTGEVRGKSDVGGVAGYNDKGTISNCYNTGKVNGSTFVGGIIGSNEKKITSNCYNTGDISGDTHVGGVAGWNYMGTVANCYNTGDVSGSEYCVGGVAGINHGEGTVENCYNTGSVSGEEDVGGVAGYNDNATIDYCYYDKVHCPGIKAVGEKDDTDKVTGLTTEQMTGTGALKNMLFAYGTGETSPWMERANDANTLYYPHLKGFLYDTTGDSGDWPPTIPHIHTWDGGKVTKKATETQTGVKTFTCTGCKATRTETIPKLKPVVSGTPMAKVKAGKKSLTISWNKVKGAAGYDIFFAKCNHGKKEVKCKKVKTIKAGKTFKWTKTGLKKGTAYKAYVKAFVYENGKKSYVRTSPMVHAYTGNGSKTESNAKSVKVNKTKVVLKKGKTFKVKAKVIKVSKKKKLISKKHAPTLRYLSTNKKVATVSKSGKITAKGKGICTIIAFAHNGVSKSIKVTVK